MYVYVTYRVYRDICSVNGQFKTKQDSLDNKTDLSKNEPAVVDEKCTIISNDRYAITRSKPFKSW